MRLVIDGFFSWALGEIREEKPTLLKFCETRFVSLPGRLWDAHTLEQTIKQDARGAGPL